MSTPESSAATKTRTRSVIVEPPADAPDGRDRRKHTRHPLTRPAKLFCPGSGRFLAGRTRNISAGGVLVEIDAPDSITSGDAIKLTIAFGDRFIVPMSELVGGSVVRAITTDNAETTCLAIAYDDATETTPQS